MSEIFRRREEKWVYKLALLPNGNAKLFFFSLDKDFMSIEVLLGLKITYLTKIDKSFLWLREARLHHLG